jgi:hypothetical protein
MTTHPLPARVTTRSGLLGALLGAIGVSAVAGLVLAVAADAGVRSAFDASLGDDRPSAVMAVLDGFGIIVPVFVLGFGLIAGRLAWGVARRDVGATRSARDAVTWLALLGAVVSVARLVQGTPWLAETSSPLLATIGGALGPALAAAVAALLQRGLARAARAPGLREEPLVRREARTAWSLLVPALIILLLVAARPLETTVITSFTDKVFASDEVPNFVGLAHYRRLLTLSFVEVPCRLDDDGACARNARGDIRWEPLPRELLVEGYRTAWTGTCRSSPPPIAPSPSTPSTTSGSAASGSRWCSRPPPCRSSCCWACSSR